MVHVKVRKKDEELKRIAPSVKSIVDIAEDVVAENAGTAFGIRHNVNLYLGDKQRFANNPRSGKMYIQYRGINAAARGEDIQNLYISGILHEVGHSYLKIENSLRRAKESIASEALANAFALVLMDDVCARLDKNAWLVRNDYPNREKKWYAEVFRDTKTLLYPLEATRFLMNTMDKRSLFDMIRRFNLKHKTYTQFLEILEGVLGGKAKEGFSRMMDSFDLEQYAVKYKKKV